MEELSELIKLAENKLKEKQELLDSSLSNEKSHLQGFINNLSSEIFNVKMTLPTAIKGHKTYINFKYEIDRIIKSISDLKI